MKCVRGGGEWSLNVDASLNLNSVQSAELKNKIMSEVCKISNISLLL